MQINNVFTRKIRKTPLSRYISAIWKFQCKSLVTHAWEEDKNITLMTFSLDFLRFLSTTNRKVYYVLSLINKDSFLCALYNINKFKKIRHGSINQFLHLHITIYCNFIHFILQDMAREDMNFIYLSSIYTMQDMKKPQSQYVITAVHQYNTNI